MTSDDELRRRVREALRAEEASVVPPSLDRLGAMTKRPKVGRLIVAVAAAVALVASAGWVVARRDNTSLTSTADNVPTQPSSGSAPTLDHEPTELAGPACSALRSPEPVIDGPLSASPEVADQQRARAKYGFASDEATVAAIIEAGPPELPPEIDALGNDLAQGLGLTLTAAEVQDMYERQLGPIRDASSEAIAVFAAAHPDTYQGRWIDQAAGGVFRVAVSGDVAAQWAELEPTLPTGHRVEIQAADYSRIELDRFRGEASAIVDELGLQASVGVSESLGMVTVRLTSGAGVELDGLKSALADLPACIDPPAESTAEPDPAPEGPLPAGFRTHARFPATDEMGTLAVAVTNDEVVALWPARPELGAPPAMVEGEQILLRFTVADDACPEIFGGLNANKGTYEIRMLAAGYRDCDLPLIRRTFIVTIDRSEGLPLEAGDITIVLPTDDPFYDEVSVTVPLSQMQDTPALPPTPAMSRVPLTENRGEMALPSPGTAVAGLLDDGTPVVVVALEDGTVAAVDPRIPAGTTLYGSNDRPAARALTSWWGGSGRFLGGGVWDRFGRALDNGPHADLIRYEAEVVGDMVRIGQLARVRVPGDPIITEEPLGPNVEPILPSLVSLTVAESSAVGTVVQIDATVVIRSDIGGRICELGEPASVSDLETCPGDASGIDDLSFESPDGRLWTFWFHGPVLARRTETGFFEVVAMGGQSASAS